jgi:hypothetical protein
MMGSEELWGVVEMPEKQTVEWELRIIHHVLTYLASGAVVTYMNSHFE